MYREQATTIAPTTDPSPWLCTLCGRMSSPTHIGPLHGIAMFHAQSEVKYAPRSPEQVAANVEERDQVVLSALNHPSIRARL